MTGRKKVYASLIMLAVFVCTTFFTMYAASKHAIEALALPTSFRALGKEEADALNAVAAPKYGDAVQPLPEAAKKQEYITLIAALDVPTISDALGDEAVSEKIGSAAYSDAAAAVRRKQNELLRALKKAGVSYVLENRYDTLLSGVAVRIKTSDFSLAEEKIESLGGKAVISEVYAVPKTIQSSAGTYQTAETKEGVTENKVDVQETGIFNSAGSKYDGTGTIVAVIDSSFDYTHSIFDYTRSAYKESFNDDTVAVSFEDIRTALGKTNAIKTSPTLTANDVFYSNKIPFMYDYADYDADVYPLESEHGTHVAGIIAGDDAEYAVVRDSQGKETTLDYKVRGVAPGAQLALMKVFSDVDAGARQSHILAAVEDCVNLGVDAINMSVGMSAGFAREVDKEYCNYVYDKVRDAGISLIAAASNDYNSTYGSEANGNLPLTSNPDSATVGSPSTYDAAISVASISGVKTPYIEFEGSPIYYFEASNSGGKPYNFMDMLLKSRTSGTFTYVSIPGVGALGSYSGIDVRGKIALVRRGQNTFEEKVQAAGAAGAAGIIIYNNVSGDIRMNVGNYLYELNNGEGVGCISMSQDDGERLAAKGTGTIKLDKTNLAGPFMSDFSSWGPTPDLGIKPEITAHGGDILSATPGQRYDRMSGTSMASPNQCGVHMLVRQYVKDNYPELTSKEVARRVNQLLMSTAVTALDEDGNPYSVRKQGAGLANLTDATTTRSLIGVKEYDENGAEQVDEDTKGALYKNTTKLELGDDPERTGVYKLKFSVINITDTASSFTVDALVFSEGVSTTLTDKDETTSDQRAYMFRDATHSDASVSVEATSASGTTPVVGNNITVSAKSTLDVTVTLTLSQTAKDYLDKSFEFGMYVEGFVCLNATDGGVSLRAPFLAFYGDWAEAPIFDLTYYETNPDELNEAIDNEDKIKPDAWATRPIAGVEKDFIGYMGAYYFEQDPSKNPIPAQEEHIALSNGTSDTALNYLYAVWAGMLRGCKEVDIVITEQVTGREVWRRVNYNVRKSYSYGAGIIYANVEVGFHPGDYNLKNNTKYEVTLTGHLDYKNDGTGENHKNTKNTYSFVFTTDFAAPQLQDVRYYTEYDKDTKSTRVYADVSVYDNHYLQCLRTIVWNGSVIEKEYYTPVYGSENAINVVTIELTDYLAYVSQSLGSVPSKNGNSIMLFAYDYAMNHSLYELRIPDDIQKIYFEKGSKDNPIVLSENETLRLAPDLYPTESYAWGLEYSVADDNIARVVGDTLLGLKKGETQITVRAKRNTSVSQVLYVKVLGEGDEGYRRYDKPTVNSFTLTGYDVDYAHYARYSDEQTVGITGTTRIFDRVAAIEMYPGESVTVHSDLKAYFPENTEIRYTVRNDRYAKILQKGNNVTITALAKGSTIVTATAYVDGKATMYTASVSITINDPYIKNGPYLETYKGLGGVVYIPDDENFIQISQFAFSYADSIDKDPSKITEEDPYFTTNWPHGDEDRPDKITEVHIPEGVEVIDQYAFAKLTGLEKVFLPKSLRQINAGAFMGCTNLKVVSGLQYVQIISKDAFKGCTRLKSTSNLVEQFVLSEAIGIGAGAFEGCAFTSISLEKVQSAAANAFKGCESLASVKLGDKIKLAGSVFEGCLKLKKISVNAPVIPDDAFRGCTALEEVEFGPDVKEVGRAAFAGTQVRSFTLDPKNQNFTVGADGLLLSKDGTTVITAAPKLTLAANNSYTVASTTVTKIGNGAFSHVTNLEHITLSATGNITIGEYAFADLANLSSIDVPSGKITEVQRGAFRNTALTALPATLEATAIGEYAFAGTKIGEVSLAAAGSVKTVIGAHAFAGTSLTTLSVSGEAEIGESAFRGCDSLDSVTFAHTVTVGAYAFYGCKALTGIDGSANITRVGDYAFAESGLTSIDLSALTDQTENGTLIAPAIGEWAFYLAPLTGAGITAVPNEAITIGAHAFMGNTAIAMEAAFAEGTVLGEFAFAGRQISDFTPFAGVTEIGAYAFAGTALTSADLSGKTVGIGAFLGCTSLASVTLPDAVAAAVFYGDTALSEVQGLEEVTEIGEMAFVQTALTEANLSNATKIGRLAFKDSKLASVVLGKALSELGDNPFAGTDIPVFTKEGEADKFGLKPILTTYDISDSVKVIDGALYASLGGGKMELITLSKTSGVQFTVAEGTVRISDYAAAYNESLAVVYLPYTLASIGQGAFFKSDALAVVNFGSVKAPILEAEFDLNYAELHSAGIDSEDLYITDKAAGNFLHANNPYIADYLPEALNVWYNNNFKGYIGDTKGLMMVYPRNGVGYDSLLYKTYFSYQSIGEIVAEDATRAVIAQIDALPSNISLADEAAITAARVAYDRLSTAQASLVYNYDVLTRAEQRLQALKAKEIPPDPPTDDKSDKKGNGSVTALTVVVVLLSVIVVALAAVLTIMLLKKKSEGEESENGEAPQVDGATDEPETPEAEKEQPQAEEQPEAKQATEAAEGEEKAENAEKPAEEKAEAPKKPRRKKVTKADSSESGKESNQ